MDTLRAVAVKTNRGTSARRIQRKNRPTPATARNYNSIRPYINRKAIVIHKHHGATRRPLHMSTPNPARGRKSALTAPAIQTPMGQKGALTKEPR
ncbi:hypothetical protein TcasGA2_TC011767 [Tribolium castaneum]|uniref:Uncharacterized protein n=1 Tax=Tribolium castaneum TaxID=7070 RepID=D6WZU9_TRICA|nr:hypothetical protein TcasGA2_TC011767 [Tribolium castaneum]